MDEATKGTDLNGREPLAAGGKKRMEKVGADLNGRGPTISQMVRNEQSNSKEVESEELVWSERRTQFQSGADLNGREPERKRGRQG